MNPMIQGLLGNLNSQAGMQRPMGGLLGGGMPQGLLGGFHPFQPNFNTSMFQRAPYAPPQFSAPNIAATPQPPGPSRPPLPGGPLSAQQAAQLMAFGLPAAYSGMSTPEMAYAMSAGS